MTIQVLSAKVQIQYLHVSLKLNFDEMNTQNTKLE